MKDADIVARAQQYGDEIDPEPNEYTGIDTPQPGDPGWDIDQWDAQITEPLPVVVQP